MRIPKRLEDLRNREHIAPQQTPPPDFLRSRPSRICDDTVGEA